MSVQQQPSVSFAQVQARDLGVGDTIVTYDVVAVRSGVVVEVTPLAPHVLAVTYHRQDGQTEVTTCHESKRWSLATVNKPTRAEAKAPDPPYPSIGRVPVPGLNRTAGGRDVAAQTHSDGTGYAWLREGPWQLITHRNGSAFLHHGGTPLLTGPVPPYLHAALVRAVEDYRTNYISMHAAMVGVMTLSTEGGDDRVETLELIAKAVGGRLAKAPSPSEMGTTDRYFASACLAAATGRGVVRLWGEYHSVHVSAATSDARGEARTESVGKVEDPAAARAASHYPDVGGEPRTALLLAAVRTACGVSSAARVLAAAVAHSVEPGSRKKVLDLLAAADPAAGRFDGLVRDVLAAM